MTWLVKVMLTRMVSRDAIERARGAFELLPADYYAGSSRLFRRGDFTTDDIDVGCDDEDFIARLRALFGPADRDIYVLLHRPTGFVITGHVGGGGPVYAGGPRYRGPYPPRDARDLTADDIELIDPAEASARSDADPMLAADRNASATGATDEDRFRALRAHMKRRGEAFAGPQITAVVAELDTLVHAVLPLGDHFM